MRSSGDISQDLKDYKIGDRAMYDVFLGGSSSLEWRREFVSSISNDISIFNSMDESQEDLSEKIARNLYHIDECSLLVFNIEESTVGDDFASICIEIADSVGRGKQVLISCQGDHCSYLSRYCDYYGVLIVETVEELIVAAEDCLAQVYRCELECTSDED